MKQLFAALSLLMLTACGFTPLYAAGAGGGNIAVEEIDGRSGYTLRKELLQRLVIGLPGLNEPASLNVTLDSELDRLALQPDESAARTDFKSRADYVLFYEGEAITGSVEATTSYQVPEAPFADIPAQTDAQNRAMALLAARLVDDLRIKTANRR
ncbi:MAG: hypothetical protein AAFO63_12965 [Pseudomonadota bacterium]